MESHSIYLHIPFCRHRCAYCDFNTYAGQEGLIPEYGRALVSEIQHLAQCTRRRLPAHSIYFGGGTPSVFPVIQFEEVFATLESAFDFQPELEVTIEANPGSLSLAYLRDLRSLGVNRLSLGMQSAHTRDLAFLERQHDYGDVIKTVTWVRQVGFDNLSLDLIFGLPDQLLENWEGSLTLALGLHPEHFSLYALTMEHGTPMQYWASRGLINTPDPDAAADMYELACEKLEAAGYQQYEISNWAIINDKTKMQNAESREVELRELNINSEFCIHHSAFISQHNLQYWRNQPYLGFGAGAHGFAGGVRTANVLSPKAYIQRLTRLSGSLSFPRTPATVTVQSIDRQTEMGETMMMGLRLTREGVSDKRFHARFGASMREVFGNEICKLVDWNLLEWVDDTLRLTPRGRLLGNQVFLEFV
jgi:oxygen-independent coproporphyrinogen-3 oxidase